MKEQERETEREKVSVNVKARVKERVKVRVKEKEREKVKGKEKGMEMDLVEVKVMGWLHSHNEVVHPGIRHCCMHLNLQPSVLELSVHLVLKV
jgi:hypothetical protein